MQKRKYTDLVLPKDSTVLFFNGKLNRIPDDTNGDILSGFEDAKEGDPVDKFDLENADTNCVEDMSRMFSGAGSFNQDLSKWDVSNVENMKDMFSYAESFNQDISGWDVSNVENMRSMFSHAESFNQDISSWNVGNVIDMSYLFYRSTSFNQDLSEWDVSNVENMRNMFSYAKSFNQDLSEWDVSNVENMDHIFYEAESFSQDISTWNWDLSRINEAFSVAKFEELCEQIKYGAFENRDLHKLSKVKIEILVEHNIIDEGTALANSI